MHIEMMLPPLNKLTDFDKNRLIAFIYELTNYRYGIDLLVIASHSFYIMPENENLVKEYKKLDKFLNELLDREEPME